MRWRWRLSGNLPRLRPEVPVERAVLNGFSNVLAFDLRDTFYVRDGTGDFQDAVMSSRAEALLGHCALKQALAFGGQIAIGADLAGAHLCVGEDALAGGGKAVELNLTCAQDSFTDLVGAFRPGT